MRVLIADFDLFATTGGGQTFYRSIIEANPAIQFSYLTVNEPTSAIRPANAQPIPYCELYATADWDDYCDATPPRHFLPAFVRANNVAYSVRGRQFDVVDLPDYEHFGIFLRPALAHHGVDCRKVALSLHGRLSSTINLNWGTEGRLNRSIVALENAQFRTVDLRYGLSRSYLDEWRSKIDVESHYLNPLQFFRFPVSSQPAPSSERPNLQFIGRTEKCKGPDVFVEMAWWLPADSYARALVVGPQSWDPSGEGSTSHLKTMIGRRFVDEKVFVLPSANRFDLDRLFASRAITILPSRYDTFNFVALESLMAGCPTAVSNRAGACRFLEETFPHVPFIKIDMEDWRACLPEIRQVLHDYENYRGRLVDAVRTAPPAIPSRGLADIYRSEPSPEPSARSDADDWYARLVAHQHAAGAHREGWWKAAGKRVVKAHLAADTRRLRIFHPAQSVLLAKNALKRRVRDGWLRGPASAALAVTQAHASLERYREIHLRNEQSDAELAAKLGQYGALAATMHADRIRIWREAARIETLRGNMLVAATYLLRAMRLAGEDRFQDLPSVQAVLERHGYPRESAVAAAMFGDRRSRDELCARLLDEALVINRKRPPTNFEFVDDRRNNQACKVSVIVSLYDAADKLPFFLQALSLQTLFARGQAEVVLVDSGSPGNEYAVFRLIADAVKMPVIYARTTQRETIQAAWNRGIALSHGEFLSFLGVDEGILPPTLEILAHELDADPSLDWVQANSLMTNVNEQGLWLNDIMTYDRSGYRQALTYLDTCYLSWVGALYRRDIHERCGYYDPTFGAAGDTEFKNRVLPYVKTKVLPRTLGIFWNYPSGQTTCSPRAEIEDLRAWYLHRTLAGVRYAYGNRDPEEAEQAFYCALRYRKSYCKHWSTDVEYALNLSTFLKELTPSGAPRLLHDGLATLLATYRAMDYFSKLTATSIPWSLSRAYYVARRESRRHYELSGERVRPAYEIFNDNRYEQHTQLWGKAA